MNIDKTTSEVPKPSKETKLGFDPDRLMGSEPKGSESEVKSSEPGKLIDFDKLITRLTDRIDSKDLYSTRLERVRYTPVDGPNGSWVGERGESKYMSNNQEVNEALAKYGRDGIEYRNGVVDFSPVAEAKVTIEGMSENRLSRKDESGNHLAGNFEKANIKLAKQWNKERRDGKDDWTHTDIEKWRKENKLTWHENSDMKTCELVPTIIHEAFRHSGGVFEINKKNNRNGGFDD